MRDGIVLDLIGETLINAIVVGAVLSFAALLVWDIGQVVWRKWRGGKS